MTKDEMNDPSIRIISDAWVFVCHEVEKYNGRLRWGTIVEY